MMTNKKLFTAGAFILFLTAGSFLSYLLLRGNDISMPSISIPSVFRVPSGERALMSMDDFTFTRSENGLVAWRITSRTADLYDNRQAQLTDLEVVFKDPDHADREAVLRGASGTMDTTTGNASVRRGLKSVQVETTDGYTLTTDSLQWKAGDKMLWTNSPFKFLGNELYLEGTGLTANVLLHTMAVGDHVKAILQE